VGGEGGVGAGVDRALARAVLDRHVLHGDLGRGVCCGGHETSLVSGRKHAVRWTGEPGAAALTSAGSAVLQSSCARGHRGWKRQPGGIDRRSGGRPSITVSRVWGGRSGREMESSSAPVYGCEGSSRSSRVSTTSRKRPPYMTP